MLFQIAKKGSMEKGFKITRSPRNLATAFKCDACRFCLPYAGNRFKTQICILSVLYRFRFGRGRLGGQGTNWRFDQLRSFRS